MKGLKKCRICRAVGEKLFLKGERCFSPKCPITRKGAVPPGEKGTTRKRKKLSDYGLRLREARKLKSTYDISGKQLKKYLKEARKVSEATGEALLQNLESRLDNLVYRFGFASSRRSARQLVSHKYVLVEGKTVNIPSFRVKVGQVIGLGAKALEMETVKKMLENKKFTIPAWLERKAAVGKFTRLPKREEIETNINEQLIIEYYSR